MLNQDRSGFPFSVLAGFGITGVGDNLTFPDRTESFHPESGHRQHQQLVQRQSVLSPDARDAGQCSPQLGRRTGLQRAWISASRNPGSSPSAPDCSSARTCSTSSTTRTSTCRRTSSTRLVRSSSTPTASRICQRQAQLNALPCTLTAQESLTTSCNPQAGVITSTVGSPRQIQLALRLTF